MTFSIYGFGTGFAPAAGDVYWGADPDVDGVEAFIVLGIPIFPYKAIHVFETELITHKEAPIQYRRRLFVRAFVRRLWFFLIFGAMLFLMATIGERLDFEARLAMGIPGGFLAATSSIAMLWVWRTDQRTRDIRYVLGRHEYGSSDPADWTDEVLRQQPSAAKRFRKKTHASAVPALLRSGKYAQAMLAARLCVALEDGAEGERLTDLILRNADVRDALGQIKSAAGGKSFQLTPMKSEETRQLWQELMTGEESTEQED